MTKTKIETEETLRHRVYRFAETHSNWSKSAIVKHFMVENVPKTTIYDILRRMQNKIGPDRKVGSGPKPTKMTKAKVTLLKSMIDHSDGVSQRALASKFGVTQSYISELINNKTDIRYHKKVPTPRRTVEQEAVIRPKCSKLAKIFRKKFVVIDDESYFGLSNTQISGNRGYYSSDTTKTPEKVKQKQVADNLDQLKDRIRYALKKVSDDRIQKLGASSFRRVDRCRPIGLKRK